MITYLCGIGEFTLLVNGETEEMRNEDASCSVYESSYIIAVLNNAF